MRTAFTLLRQGHMVRLDGSSQLSEQTSNRCCRKALPRDIMGKKLKKEEVEVCIRRKLNVLKRKEKRDIFMLTSIHNEVHENKGGVKEMPKLHISYNALGLLTSFRTL
jgi:hypothetical protein